MPTLSEHSFITNEDTLTARIRGQATAHPVAGDNKHVGTINSVRPNGQAHLARLWQRLIVVSESEKGGQGRKRDEGERRLPILSC